MEWKLGIYVAKQIGGPERKIILQNTGSCGPLCGEHL